MLRWLSQLPQTVTTELATAETRAPHRLDNAPLLHPAMQHEMTIRRRCDEPAAESLSIPVHLCATVESPTGLAERLPSFRTLTTEDPTRSSRRELQQCGISEHLASAQLAFCSCTFLRRHGSNEGMGAPHCAVQLCATLRWAQAKRLVLRCMCVRVLAFRVSSIFHPLPTSPRLFCACPD